MRHSLWLMRPEASEAWGIEAMRHMRQAHSANEAVRHVRQRQVDLLRPFCLFLIKLLDKPFEPYPMREAATDQSACQLNRSTLTLHSDKLTHSKYGSTKTYQHQIWVDDIIYSNQLKCYHSWHLNLFLHNYQDWFEIA